MSCSDDAVRNFWKLARNKEEFSPIMSAPARNQSKCSLRFRFFATVALSVFCSLNYLAAQSPAPLEPGPKPPDVPSQWKPWIGEYGWRSSLALFFAWEF